MFTSLSIQAPYVFMRVFTDVKVNDLSMCRPKGVAPYQISTTSCLTKMQFLQDCSYPLHCMLAQSKNLQIDRGEAQRVHVHKT